MQGVLARYARGPQFKSLSGLVFPLPRGSVLGLRTAKNQSRVVGTCMVPSRFGAYLFKQGENWHGSIVWLGCSYDMGEFLGSIPSRAMCFDIYSMTSFDVEVIEINTITQDLDSVPAYKKNHSRVGAIITKESLHVLSLGFVLKF